MGARLQKSPDKPLYYAKEERYAQERAFGYRQREAARRAGLDDYTGIFAKYERKPRVQARIDFLRRSDLTNEYHEEKRRHLEQRLELVAFGSMFEFVVIDANGKPRLDWQALAESELGVTMAEMRFDKETGNVVHLARDSALQAINQLREMRGFKAADHHRLEISQVTQLTDEQLLQIAGSALETTPLIEARPAEDDDVDISDGGVGPA
jgi:hypothetical protein